MLARGLRAVIPLFFCSRKRGSEDTVVFPGVGGDGYFDHNGGATGLMIRRGPRSREAVQQRRSEAIRAGEGLT